MIGVLLAATPEGQRRPGLADTFSLFGGGCGSAARPGDRLPDPGWSNALALTTLIAPMLLAVLAWQQIGQDRIARLSGADLVSRLIAAGVLLVPVALGLLNLRRLAAA